MSQHVAGPASHDVLSDRLLAAHGIDGYVQSSCAKSFGMAIIIALVGQSLDAQHLARVGGATVNILTDKKQPFLRGRFWL